MRLPRKWVLSLGLMATAPGVTLAGPFGFLNPGHNEDKVVSSATRGNQEIANDVADALRAAGLQGKDIEIEVRGGVCAIKGQIADSQQKAATTRIISGIHGVEIVDNQLTLIETAGAPRAMPHEPAVQQAAFSGPVDHHVQQVSNSVEQPAMANQEVAQQIADAVAGAGLRGYEIEIRYKQGVASLIGDVGSRREAAIAEQAAQQVPGVNHVLNKLTIDGQPATPQLPQSMQGNPGQMPPQYAAQMQQQAYAEQMQQRQAYPSGFQTPQQGYPQGYPGGQSPQMMPASQTQAMPAVLGQQAGAPMQQAGHMIYNRPSMPEYAWPSYASYDNYAQVTYPSAYDASAWPYIGPFYPYPQVPMGWRDAKLEWDDGHWQLKFNARTDRWWWFLDPSNWHE